MNKHTDFDQAGKADIVSVCHQSRIALTGLLCAVCLLLASPAATSAQLSDSPSPVRQSVQTVDRAFGLHLGDLVTRSVRTSGKAARFAVDRLPEPGPVTAWVYLLSVSVDDRTDVTGDAKWLTFTYQMTGAAPVVTLVELPVLQLFESNEKSASVLARLDAMPVSVSPIMGELPFQRTGMGDLQPDALVFVVPPGVWQQMMWGMAALALLLAALFAGRLWWRQRPDKQTPFVRASASLKSAKSLGPAYRHLHRAFDSTARQSMMLDDIPAFIESNPAYRDVQTEIDQFFEASRQQFFNHPGATEIDDVNGSDDSQIRALRVVARKLARIEKELL